MVQLVDRAMVMLLVVSIRVMDVMMWGIVMWSESVGAMWVLTVLTVGDVGVSVERVVDWAAILVILDQVKLLARVDV